VAHSRGLFLPVLSLHENADSDALLDVEHVLVLRTVRAALLLLAVAVQIEYVNVIERLHQALTHASEGRIVEITVIGYEREHAISGLLDSPLREPDELHVVIVEPFRIALAKRFSIDLEVVRRWPVAVGLPVNVS